MMHWVRRAWRGKSLAWNDWMIGTALAIGKGYNPSLEDEMSWRNHETHREETKAVKTALKDAGITAKVGHGTGTAWGWLHLDINTDDLGDHHDHREGCYIDWQYCSRCAAIKAREQEALEIALKVTGRTGDYNGDIQIRSKRGE